MLGIFLIIFLAVYWLIKWQAYNLLKEAYAGPVALDSNGRTYEACYGAAVLRVISNGVVLMGYMGCAWPYLFVEPAEKSAYVLGIIGFGLLPPLVMTYASYLGIRNARAHVRISTDGIEYNGCKPFSIKLGDIKKITSFGLYAYYIQLKEKSKGFLNLNLDGFYKRKEADSLIKQLKDYVDKESGRDKSLVYRLGLWKFHDTVGRYFFACFKIIMTLALLYVSYCCIDYDFFRKDYVAEFNALGADPNQTENAWPYYVQAAVNYKEPQESIQEIATSVNTGELNLTDDQKDKLKKWFEENEASWASLKKATSIGYCNAVYERISFADSANKEDFSSPSDSGYGLIRHLYSNVDACRLAGVVDLDWFDLFRMQLASSRHFISGKTFFDQLAGYGMLGRSVNLLTEQGSYQLEDLGKTRILLQECFTSGLPSLSIEGEIFIWSSTYAERVNIKKIPVQTPLNPVFHLVGSVSGTEVYILTHFRAELEQARKGIEVKPTGFSILRLPIMRNIFWGMMEGQIARIYKVSQRADTNLLAAYFLLDLEEYKLVKGCYPEDVSQLRDAGLTSELPDDPDSGGKIIYHNDGQRAILYAVGENAKDDGGYKDEKGSGKERDDIIYWERDLKEE